MKWIRKPAAALTAIVMLLGGVTLTVAQQGQDGTGESTPAQQDAEGGPSAGESASGGGAGAADSGEGAAGDAPESAQQQQGDGETRKRDRPSAERVLQQLLRRRAENPLIEPAKPGGDRGEQGGERAEGAGRRLTPGAGNLRREGEFIIQRRGRMVRTSEDSAVWMFVFDSGGSGEGNPPMLLMPCRYLEEMESIVRDRGAADSVEFILSGQVFVYRGANYLLPTLVKQVRDRGNLSP